MKKVVVLLSSTLLSLASHAFTFTQTISGQLAKTPQTQANHSTVEDFSGQWRGCDGDGPQGVTLKIKQSAEKMKWTIYRNDELMSKQHFNLNKVSSENISSSNHSTHKIQFATIMQNDLKVYSTSFELSNSNKNLSWLTSIMFLTARKEGDVIKIYSEDDQTNPACVLHRA